MKEIDMRPYEEYFTELEKLFFERNACMNIVAYMSDRNSFTETQYNRVFNDYLKAMRAYENFIPVFEEKAVIPACGGPVQWYADFEKRVIKIDKL